MTDLSPYWLPANRIPEHLRVNEETFVSFKPGTLEFDWVGKALFSTDMRYRYVLVRTWNTADGPGPHLRHLPFVLLNPSTATAADDDPTIRRCIGFAKREGYDGLYVLNVFGLRATDPRELDTADDPEGPANWYQVDQVLRATPGPIVCGWGAKHFNSSTAGDLLANYVERLFCLGKTKNGAPRHPLYLKADTPLEAWP